ncbi:hypothetical protein HNQ56_004001 [Anaerotaenia torta]|uniref:hypothetical protein n=1 Tax=Anaerotaenia torta TaxID=433293 RepID=UPI003D2462A5
MNTSDLTYTVGTGEYLTSWLISKVLETPFLAKPVPTQFPGYRPGVSVKDEEGKERKSPAKEEFLRRGEFKASGYPADIVMDKLYYPFDTNRVDLSGFWDYPADIRFYARAYVMPVKAGMQELEIFASGAVKVWVNNRLAEEFYPYESNIEQSHRFRVYLQEGNNEIVVGCNDYGERNIVFKFGLKNWGEDLRVSLPIQADVDRITRVNKSLQACYLDKLSYSEGDLRICTDLPFPDAVELKVRICGMDKSFRAEKEQTEIIWGRVKELLIGYHELAIRTEVDGVELRTSLWAEFYPREREIGTPALYEERAKAAIHFAIHNGNPSFDSYVAGLYLGRNEYERCRKAIEQDVEMVNRRADCADFKLLRIIWILYKFRPVLSGEQIAGFEAALLNFRYWYDEPGNDAMWFFSENHALAFHVDEYLAGQLFPEKVFPNSGMTGRQHMEKARIRIVEWFEKLMEFGYNEWNSSAYISVDVRSYITLYELAEDAQLKERAEKALDLTFELYAQNSFCGVLGTSNGRAYRSDLLGNRCMGANSQIWLAWGCGCMNQEISPAIYIAMSGYQPPKQLGAAADWMSTDKYMISRLQGTFKVPTTLCKTGDYMLGSCISPRTGYFGSQEHLINLFLADADTRIWINHPGEGKIFGQRRPGYFNGNGLTPLVDQQQNTAVVSYEFPKEMLERAEVPFTHAFCDTRECDETVLDGNWLFIRRKKAYAALYSANGLEESDKALLKGKEFISRGINSTWFVKVTCETEAGSFGAFRDYMKEHTPVCREHQLYYTDYEFGEMKFSLLEEGYIRKALNSPAARELGLRSL